MIILKVKKYKNVYQTLEKFNKLLNYKHEIKHIKSKWSNSNLIAIGINIDILKHLDLLEQNKEYGKNVVMFLEEK